MYYFKIKWKEYILNVKWFRILNFINKGDKFFLRFLKVSEKEDYMYFCIGS